MNKEKLSFYALKHPVIFGDKPIPPCITVSIINFLERYPKIKTPTRMYIEVNKKETYCELVWEDEDKNFELFVISFSKKSHLHNIMIELFNYLEDEKNPITFFEFDDKFDDILQIKEISDYLMEK